MTSKATRHTLSLTQFLLIVMGTLLLYLVVNFGRQVAVSYQRRQELQQVQDRLATAQAQNQELNEYFKYAQSDAAAEEWARSQGWAKAGEVPVIVVAPQVQPTASPVNSPPPDSPGSIREAWWDLFFGTR